MLYDNDKGHITGIAKVILLRKFIAVILLGASLLLSSSCAVISKAIDNSAGLSRQLSRVETDIRHEDWAKAKTSLGDAKEAWHKVKPVIQIDIDHDYVKNIEDDFVRLDAYLDVGDKSNALAAILLIQSSWQNINSY